MSACPAGSLLLGSGPASRTLHSWHAFEVWSLPPACRLGLSGAGLGGAPLWLFQAPHQPLCSWGARAPLCPLAFQKQTEGWRVGARGPSFPGLPETDRRLEGWREGSQLPGPGRVLWSVTSTPRSSLAAGCLLLSERQTRPGLHLCPGNRARGSTCWLSGLRSSLLPPGLVPALHASRAPVRRSLGASLEWGLCGVGPEGVSDAPKPWG